MSKGNFRKDDFIDETDPLPGGQGSEGRWAEPYKARDTGLWTVHLRGAAIRQLRDRRILGTLTARDPYMLGELMAQQDEVAREIER